MYVFIHISTYLNNHIQYIVDSSFFLSFQLDVSRNELSSLPEEIGRLRSLRELDASANRLTSLPGSLASLPQLFVLALQNNCFETLPPVALACR